MIEKISIDNMTPIGKKILFFSALAVALIIAWLVVDRIVPGKNDADIDKVIKEKAEKYDVSASLVKAIIWKESRFKVKAVGKAGEIGLMQIMPIAVEEWRKGNNLKKAPSREKLFEPSVNLEIGVWYLAWTGKHWDGYASKEILQLSEYNAGYGNVIKNWKPKKPGDIVKIENITIASTRQYITEILDKKAEYEK